MPIGAIIGAGSSLVSGLIGSRGASKAASAQQAGAEKARQIIEKGQGEARDFQNQIWSGTQQAEQPYQDVGSTSANNLRNLLQAGFKAPTLEDVQNTPGYQFRLGEGINALDKSAAARGDLFSGTQGKAITDYAENLAQSTYNQDYQNALSTYMANYQTLLGGTDVGLNSTSQLGSFGQSAANTMAGIDLGGAEAQAQQINNAAAARASGYLGSANAWQGAAGGVTGALQSWNGQHQPSIFTNYDPNALHPGQGSSSNMPAPVIPGTGVF